MKPRRAAQRPTGGRRNEKPANLSKTPIPITDLLERISDGFVAFDNQLNYTYVNQRGGELLGRKPEDLIGKNYWTEFPEAQGTPFARAYVHALETQTPIFIEDYYAPWDRWFENRIYPSNDGLSILFTEITERKKAEEAVRAQKDFISTLADMTPGIVYLYDLETQTNVYFNGGLLRLMGYDQQNIQNMGLQILEQLFHPDDLPALANFEEKMEAARDDEVFELEYRVRHANGAWRWIHSYERPFMRRADGRLKQKIGLAIDVTERKQAEILKLGEKQALEMIAGNAPLAQILDTITRNIEAQSPGLACTILLLDPDGIHLRHGSAPSMPGTYIRTIDGEPIGPQAGSCGTAAYRKEPVYVYDIASDPLWDKYREVALQHGLRACWSTPIKTFDDRVLGTFAMYYGEPRLPGPFELQLIEFATHLAEIAIVHKQAEQELRESEERFAKIFYASPMPVTITRVSDSQYVDANESFLKRMGYQREEVLGHTALELGMWAEPAERTEMLRILTEQGSLRDFEAQFRTKSGEVGTALLFREIIELGGEKHFIGTTLDISDRKRAEIEIKRLLDESQKRLKQMEALHSIDLAISASMDLQTTLQVLLRYVESLLNIDATAILLFNPMLQQFHFSAARGFRAHSIESAQVRWGANFAGLAAAERRTISLGGDLATQSHSDFSKMYESEGFMAYVGAPLLAKGEIKGVLEVYHRSPHKPDTEWLNLLETLAGQAAIAIDNAQLFNNLRQSNLELALAYDATIAGWSRAMDLRDRETEGHTQRVTDLTLKLARVMNIPEAQLTHIRRGALLHDIGKIGVPDSILLKPAPLTEAEWQEMRKHPQLAFDMLASIRYLQPALDIPYCHHEKWDGSGYPRGLHGESIPIAARLFAIVDVWDAITSDRPYRKAWSHAQATEYIQQQAGKYFDPHIVEVFLSLMASQ